MRSPRADAHVRSCSGPLQPPRRPRGPCQDSPPPCACLDPLVDRHSPIVPAVFWKLDAVAVLTTRFVTGTPIALGAALAAGAAAVLLDRGPGRAPGHLRTHRLRHPSRAGIPSSGPWTADTDHPGLRPRGRLLDLHIGQEPAWWLGPTEGQRAGPSR
jgi:hypothetical protein